MSGIRFDHVEAGIRNAVCDVEKSRLCQGEIKVRAARSHQLGNCFSLIVFRLGFSHSFTHPAADLVGSRQAHLIEKGLAVREVTVRRVG